jgi:hypothetical protein
VKSRQSIISSQQSNTKAENPLSEICGKSGESGKRNVENVAIVRNVAVVIEPFL